MEYKEQFFKIVSNITRIREGKGWSKQELAFRADMDRSSISEIESGRTDIRLTTLCRIANALEVSVSELVDFDVRK